MERAKRKVGKSNKQKWRGKKVGRPKVQLYNLYAGTRRGRTGTFSRTIRFRVENQLSRGRLVPQAPARACQAREPRDVVGCAAASAASACVRAPTHASFWTLCAEDEDDDWETTDLKVPDAKDEEAWSDEEGHDAHKAAAAEPMKPMSAPAPPKPKSSLQLKIEAREQRDKEEAEAKAAMRAQLMGDGGADMPEDVSDEAAKRMRQTRLEEAANIDNAMDAFGLGLATAKADKEEKQRHDQRQTKAEAEVAAAGGFEVYEPKSDAEFEKLAEMISTKLGKYDGKKGQAICLKAMLRSLSTTMSSDECKARRSVTTSRRVAPSLSPDRLTCTKRSAH